MNIRPVSDLRNKFPEIESIVKEGKPVYLTKNGYGSMVVLSIEQFSHLINIETKLTEADKLAASDNERISHEDLFRDVRSVLHDK